MARAAVAVLLDPDRRGVLEAAVADAVGFAAGGAAGRGSGCGRRKVRRIRTRPRPACRSRRSVCGGSGLWHPGWKGSRMSAARVGHDRSMRAPQTRCPQRGSSLTGPRRVRRIGGQAPCGRARAGLQAGDDLVTMGHHLAAATALLAKHAHDAVVLERRPFQGARRSRASRRWSPLGRVDEPVVRHAVDGSHLTPIGSSAA